jgi:hypothetical protein
MRLRTGKPWRWCWRCSVSRACAASLGGARGQASAEAEKGRTGEWAKRVERWRDSGLTTAEFAAPVGINAKTLTYWAWTLEREAIGDKRVWAGKEEAAYCDSEGKISGAVRGGKQSSGRSRFAVGRSHRAARRASRRDVTL